MIAALPLIEENMNRLSGKARSRRAALRRAARWLLYVAVLLVFYSVECCSLFRGASPLLIIPLATAVAMHEGDLAGGVFGAFCGLMLDMANGVTVAGFSALWLLVFCPLISLLAQFFVKSNAVSHFVMNATVCVFMAAMDMLFLHWVWERGESSISFTHSVLPAYGWAALLSVPVFLLVRLISRKTRPAEERRLEESAQDAEEKEDKERT